VQSSRGPSGIGVGVASGVGVAPGWSQSSEPHPISQPGTLTVSPAAVVLVRNSRRDHRCPGRAPLEPFRSRMATPYAFADWSIVADNSPLRPAGD
jgi:hypothetical protein